MQYMLPILLIYQSALDVEGFLKNYQGKNNFSDTQVFHVKPIKTELTLDQVRQVKKELILSSSRGRLFIIEALDKSGAEPQNALLKTFEEKSLDNQFILPVQNLDAVLPTIQSRSMVVRLQRKIIPIRPTTTKLIQDTINALSTNFLANTSLDAINREEVELFLTEIISYFQAEMQNGSLAAARICKKTLKLRQLLTSNNIIPSLTVDNTLLLIHSSITKAPRP